MLAYDFRDVSLKKKVSFKSIAFIYKIIVNDRREIKVISNPENKEFNFNLIILSKEFWEINFGF